MDGFTIQANKSIKVFILIGKWPTQGTLSVLIPLIKMIRN